MTDAQALRKLAHLVGVQTAYYDVSRHRRHASPESLLLVLKQLGAPLEKLGDAPDALRAERDRLSQRLCSPTHVIWDGDSPVVPVQVPSNGASKLECRLVHEDGATRHWTLPREKFRVFDNALRGAPGRRVVGLRLPTSVPYGYHHLELAAGKFACGTLILRAPRRAFQSRERIWGVFAPPYALRSRINWGAGSFSDLEAVADWVRGLGGRVVATLPMLAALLDEPFDHSPYAPASRLYWNEFYIDVDRIPELQQCRKARALRASATVRLEISALRAKRGVDYRRLMRLKRQILEALAKHFFATPCERRQAFESYVRDHPAVVDYAEFRAVLDRQRIAWGRWPERQRMGTVEASDYDADAKHYHLYAQWVAHEQVHELGRKLRDSGTKLYLDFPLGVHADGYDVWRQRELFVLGLSAGAPPDSVFTRGQSWGFPPLHPRRLREQRYAHFIEALRHHLRSATILRFDHVMALHRLFCIPRGLEARDGVYVKYPAEDLYAILAIESHRHAATIVGENLGTVPAYVNKCISARGLEGMYVLQYEVKPERRRPFPPVPRNSVASTNTHDMPPFASYWEGLDIAQREKLGLLNAVGARHERNQRQLVCKAVRHFLEKRHWLKHGQKQSTRTVHEACLAFLSASPARVALVGLEDLWLEKNAQNVPGTGHEMPNWQRKMRYTYEEFSRMRGVLTCLERVDSLRKGENVDGWQERQEKGKGNREEA